MQKSYILHVQHSSNLLTLLHSVAIRYPTARFLLAHHHILLSILFAHHHDILLYLSLPPISNSLKFDSNSTLGYSAPALLKGLLKTSVHLLIILARLFTRPLLPLHSPLLLPLTTENRSLRALIPLLYHCHYKTVIIITSSRGVHPPRP